MNIEHLYSLMGYDLPIADFIAFVFTLIFRKALNIIFSGTQKDQRGHILHMQVELSHLRRLPRVLAVIATNSCPIITVIPSLIVGELVS